MLSGLGHAWVGYLSGQDSSGLGQFQVGSYQVVPHFISGHFGSLRARKKS